MRKLDQKMIDAIMAETGFLIPIPDRTKVGRAASGDFEAYQGQWLIAVEDNGYTVEYE